MARKIVWTKRASTKFRRVIGFLEIEWGNLVAENFVKKSFDIIELIGENPELGTIENKSKEIRGFLLSRHNRMFYRVTATEIIILNIFDTRSGPKRKKF